MKNPAAIFIPADVPAAQHERYKKNYSLITKNTDHLALFAGDQKIEHLNKDFYGTTINEHAVNPNYLFEIAQSNIFGAFATQLGLIARYGSHYKNINYIVKLNSKTDIIPKTESDPLSTQLWNINDVLEFQSMSNLSICGIGYTVYLGSAYENVMLHEAAQAIFTAHQHGLIAIVWMYPRGQHILNEKDSKLITGAAGVANCLGADFAKVNVPLTEENQNNAALSVAVQAAGNTKLICSGGKRIDAELLLKQLSEQLHVGTAGCAYGRNIYQRSMPEALTLSKAIAAMVYEQKSLEDVLKML